MLASPVKRSQCRSKKRRLLKIYGRSWKRFHGNLYIYNEKSFTVWRGLEEENRTSSGTAKRKGWLKVSNAKYSEKGEKSCASKYQKTPAAGWYFIVEYWLFAVILDVRDRLTALEKSLMRQKKYWGLISLKAHWLAEEKWTMTPAAIITETAMKSFAE